jgi:predicted nucleic acid-binding protein
VILVDTSIWIDHFRQANGVLERLLASDQVLGHPFVVGELALGNLPQRASLLQDLSDLPAALVATHEEAMVLIAEERLYGLGITYIDLHLLASTLLTSEALLWTRDRRLVDVASRLQVRAAL